MKSTCRLTALTISTSGGNAVAAVFVAVTVVVVVGTVIAVAVVVVVAGTHKTIRKGRTGTPESVNAHSPVSVSVSESSSSPPVKSQSTADVDC